MPDSILISAIWQGILLGFGLAFLLGPAFFALLDASLHYGLGVSVAIALGVVSSDVLLLTISYLAMNSLSEINHFQAGMALVGFVVLTVSGGLMIKNRRETVQNKPWQIDQFWSLFIKGFSINTFNPFPWLFWLSTAAVVHSQFGSTGWKGPFLFFGGAALTVFITDVAKAAGARLIQPYLNANALSIIRLISGVCLIGFGIKLLWTAIQGW